MFSSLRRLESKLKITTTAGRIPLPGNISEDKIYAILLDMTTLSMKLNKPLSTRLLPVPNKNTGAITHFEPPYLVNCKILEIK